MNRVELLQEAFRKSPFRNWGQVQLHRPLSIELYREWIVQDKQGSMSYLAEHLPVKENPQLRWPQANSALVILLPYVPHPYPPEQGLGLSGEGVALYAQGLDYHLAFRAQMEDFVRRSLSPLFPDEEFVVCTDAQPIMERDLAARAGLGWIGKNSCLLNREIGSLFLIGEILTTLPSPPAPPLTHDFCGTCRRCIESCPTSAIEETRTLDAKKCISYWTIESKELPPLELREKFGSWLFGCDICQTVCPWNIKFYSELKEATPLNEKAIIEDIKYILLSSNKRLQKDLRLSALSRAAGTKLKRNALIVVGNLELKSLKKETQFYLEHETLGEVARWALQKLEVKGLT